jgi:hypothetical protein
LQDFIDSNPNNLSDADLELAASWKNRVAAKFFIMRHLQKYSLFLSEPFALKRFPDSLAKKSRIFRPKIFIWPTH